MNSNSSKQAVLSIVGIAVLLIAVVGVTFAFFTYSRTGTTNNVITTGTINFSFNEGENSIKLANQFPQTDTNGKNNTPLEFDVTGFITSGGTDITYDVYAIAGDVVYTNAAGEIVEQGASGATARTRMSDDYIKVYVTGSGATGSDTITVETAYATGGKAVNSATGFKVASGTIKADGTQHTHSYALRIWVDSAVTISDTDATATFRASAITDSTPDAEKANNKPVYANMYYSLKIKVEARA